jgi:predicted  nucleic acid-binding Zn-ribbon protein
MKPGTEVGRLEGQATELRRQLNDERRRVRELEKLQSELVIARTRQSELQSQLDLLKKKHADVELELQLELKQERESHSAMQIELAQAQELIATLEAELESAKNEPFDFREAKGHPSVYRVAPELCRRTQRPPHSIGTRQASNLG